MKTYPSCSLCIHFEPNKSTCSLLNKETKPLNQEYPASCVESGHFIRDINVLLDSYHFFAANEPVPSNFKIDLSRLPTDNFGTPLFVMTKRGMERAIPAYPELTLKGDMLLGVHKAHTYQGQRELISDLGVEVAQEVAKGRGVRLIILKDEIGSTGKPEEIQRFRMYQKPRIKTTNSWALKEGDDW
ncbi:hypothetical protein V6B14_22785 (plasmid) [Sporosarcina psychrophila]|uniref:hypothetical protein n=1 Tax=Sporosarcina psychrophila TaxID=1476 RepID=UPI0030D15BC9